MARTRTRRGTTLIEIMAAVFVLTMTVVAAGALFPLSSLLRDRSGGYSQAAAAAQHKVEQIRRLDAGQINASSLLSRQIIDTADPAGTASSAVFPFTATDRLAQKFAQGQGLMVVTGMGSDLVRVDVEVRWKAFTGKAHVHRVTTFVADKTPWRVP